MVGNAITSPSSTRQVHPTEYPPLKASNHEPILSKKRVPAPGAKGPTKVIGHGWFPVQHGRRRRYRCRGCGGTFSKRIDTACYRFRCSRRTFDRVANMAVEGMSRAAIARNEGGGWNTVNRWLRKAADFAHRFKDARIREIELIERHRHLPDTRARVRPTGRKPGFILPPTRLPCLALSTRKPDFRPSSDTVFRCRQLSLDV